MAKQCEISNHKFIHTKCQNLEVYSNNSTIQAPY